MRFSRKVCNNIKYLKLIEVQWNVCLFLSVSGVELGIRNERKRISAMWQNHIYLSIENPTASRGIYAGFSHKMLLCGISIFVWEELLVPPSRAGSVAEEHQHCTSITSVFSLPSGCIRRYRYGRWWCDLPDGMGIRTDFIPHAMWARKSL